VKHAGSDVNKANNNMVPGQVQQASDHQASPTLIMQSNDSAPRFNVTCATLGVASKSSTSVIMTTVQKVVWNSTIPLSITIQNDPECCPYLVNVPRLSYLAFLLPRLNSFFNDDANCFTHEDIPLKNLPVGLLVDLYNPPLPWKLEVRPGPLMFMHDTFINCVKEVGFLS
jgi:hypothetical protein